MLSILVLAAITAISFSLATIVFVELRSAGDSVRTEPALYATLGVTEEALFQYKRYVNERESGTATTTMDVPTCYTPSDPTDTRGICKLGNVTITMPTNAANPTQPLSYDQTPHVETILAGQTHTLPLYQLNDWSIQYGRLYIQRLPDGNSGDLTVSIKQIHKDNTPDEWPLDHQSLAVGSFIDYQNFLTDNQYELILTNSDPANSVQVSILSYDAQLAPKGLPFIGKKVLKVVADYLGLTRSYTVQIPVP